MRYIIAGPNAINDLHVNKIKNLRLEFMQHARILNTNNESEVMDIADFDLMGNDWEEKKELNGSWHSMKKLNEETLPAVRTYIQCLIKDKQKDVMHVDLGKSLIPLYIAYFSVMENIATNISFHMPGPDQEQVFNIGGDSAYANPRNNIRRYLATVILNKAMTVFIDNPTIVSIFQKLFPRINREIHLDPLLQIQATEEQDVQNV